MLSLIGKKVVAVKSWRYDGRKKKHFPPMYVLFDDGETYIQLEDQDYYAFHDCDSSAKRLLVYHNKRIWDIIMENKDGRYPDADENFIS